MHGSQNSSYFQFIFFVSGKKKKRYERERERERERREENKEAEKILVWFGLGVALMMISRSIVDVIAWAIDQLAFLKAKQQKGFVCRKPSGLFSYIEIP
jgi:hypothetical protein